MCAIFKEQKCAQSKMLIYFTPLEICDKVLPVLSHAKPNINTTMYTNGTEVLYTCDDGYTTQSGSLNSVTCNAKTNTWSGQMENCTALSKSLFGITICHYYRSSFYLNRNLGRHTCLINQRL